MVSCLLTLTDL